MSFDIEQERRDLGNIRLDNAIEEYQEAKLTEDTPALENRLNEIDILLGFQNERPQPQITEWDDIPDANREWLIPHWLPANTVTMFTGDGGAGKSWLTLQAVCQIACGFQDAYLNPNYEITPPADYDAVVRGTLTSPEDAQTPKPIIFATYEDEPAEIKRRLHVLASGMPWIAESMNTIKQHLHIVDMRGIGSVWGPGIGQHIANTGDLLAAGEDLRTICENKKAKLLVMDPLSGAFGGNENDRTAVYDFVSSFRGWGDQAKCAMLVIGHLPKSAEAKAAGFSGSTAWEASARSMWRLVKEGKKEKEHWVLKHTKANYAQLQDMIPLIRKEVGWWKKAEKQEDAAKALDDYQNREPNPQEDNHDAEIDDLRFDV